MPRFVKMPIMNTARIGPVKSVMADAVALRMCPIEAYQNANTPATAPETRVRMRPRHTSWLSDLALARSGLIKSFTRTVDRELMPESMLDIAAAKMPVISRPDMPSGRACMM